MWKAPKAGKEFRLPFGPNIYSWGNVIFLCLTCLLIISRSKFLFQCYSPDIIHWIFPHYSSRGKSGDNRINILKECQPRVESLCRGVTGSEIYGMTANVMVYNNKCHIISVVSRGRWD